MKKQKKAKKNPRDATIRNIKASNKRDAALAKRVTVLEKQVQEIRAYVNHLLKHTYC